MCVEYTNKDREFQANFHPPEVLCREAGFTASLLAAAFCVHESVFSMKRCGDG
jgi:hypothetical protein